MPKESDCKAKQEGNSLRENLKMKPNFLVLFIFAIMGSTDASGDNRLKFSVKEVSIDKMSMNWVGWPKANVELELKNLTGDTLIFLTYSHHDYLYSIDGDGTYINAPKYEISEPVFYTLLPHKSCKETISVMSLQNDAKFSPFKVGINLFEPKEKKDPYKADIERRRAETINTLWTDYIQIK